MTIVSTVLAQNATVTTHWQLNKSIKDLAVGSAAYNSATASTTTCEGTDVKQMLETSVTFGSKLAFQATITPQSYATKEVTGLQLLRFKVQGAADGSNDYGMILQIKPNTTDLTYVPTKVGVSVASWVKNSSPPVMKASLLRSIRISPKASVLLLPISRQPMPTAARMHFPELMIPVRTWRWAT